MNNKKTPSTIEMLKSIKESGDLEVKNSCSNQHLIEKGNKLCRKGWLYFRCYNNRFGITHYRYTLTDKGRKFLDNALLPKTPILTTLLASIEVSKEQIREVVKEVIEEASKKGKHPADDIKGFRCIYDAKVVCTRNGNCNGCPFFAALFPKGKDHTTDAFAYSTLLKSEPRSENLFSGCLHFGECKRGHNGTCIGCSIYTKHLQTKNIKPLSEKEIAAMPQANHYTNGTDFGRIVCFDLDGVILKFDGWKGENVFGEVVKGARSAINWLKDNGWYIIIFTTRLVTPELVKLLDEAGIPYDDINGRTVTKGYTSYQSYEPAITDYTGHMVSLSHYWKHNPAKASIKPIATVYVDDCDWRQEGKNFDQETWALFLHKMQKRFHNGRS